MGKKEEEARNEREREQLRRERKMNLVYFMLKSLQEERESFIEFCFSTN